jgi:hypothetical protein
MRYALVLLLVASNARALPYNILTPEEQPRVLRRAKIESIVGSVLFGLSGALCLLGLTSKDTNTDIGVCTTGLVLSVGGIVTMVHGNEERYRARWIGVGEPQHELVVARRERYAGTALLIVGIALDVVAIGGLYLMSLVCGDPYADPAPICADPWRGLVISATVLGGGATITGSVLLGHSDHLRRIAESLRLAPTPTGVQVTSTWRF